MAPRVPEIIFELISKLGNFTKNLCIVLQSIGNELVLDLDNIKEYFLKHIFSLSLFGHDKPHIVKLEELHFFVYELLDAHCCLLFSLLFGDLHELLFQQDPIKFHILIFKEASVCWHAVPRNEALAEATDVVRLHIYIYLI